MLGLFFLDICLVFRGVVSFLRGFGGAFEAVGFRALGGQARALAPEGVRGLNIDFPSPPPCPQLTPIFRGRGL